MPLKFKALTVARVRREGAYYDGSAGCRGPKPWGSGLRFAVPRLQSSHDETPPKSGAIREDDHADPTQIHRHDAGRRRYAGHRRAAGAAAARKQAYDRRCPGAFLESKFTGLALGTGCHAAIAGAIHYRARAADDGRGWRRPRRHRAAGPERPE